MAGRVARYVRRNAVAWIALFVALGGVSYAAIRIPANSVGTRQLKRNAVVNSRVKAHSLTARVFKNGTLLRGATGATGPEGPKGNTGSTGPTGPAGATNVSVVASAPVTTPANSEATATANCPARSKATGGGAQALGSTNDVKASNPSTASANGRLALPAQPTRSAKPTMPQPCLSATDCQLRSWRRPG